MKEGFPTRRLTILLSVLLLSVTAIVVLLLVGGKEAVPVEPPVSQAALYTIGVWEGQLAVFQSGEPEPDSVYDVFVATLPAEEQTRLEQGIPVYSEEQLTSLLEDYTS